MTMFESLAAAQAEIRHAQKDAKNPHFKNTYATLEAVLDAVKPPLNKHGFSVIQTPATVDGERVLRTILLHASGEQISGEIPLIVQKNDMQGLGSAITYARRYGLAAMLGVAQTDDDGEGSVVRDGKSEQSASPKGEKSPSKPKTSQAQHPDFANIDGTTSATRTQNGLAKFEEELRACTDYDSLICFLADARTKAFIAAVKETRAGTWLGQDDYPGLKNIIEARKTALAAAADAKGVMAA